MSYLAPFVRCSKILV